MAKKSKETKLNPQQEAFCKNFASEREFYGNGVQSYIDAYDVDMTKPGAYEGSRASASRLLSNVNILARIDELIESGGLNDQFVDKQLKILITQKAELGTSLQAVREYNKLKARIDHKVKVEGELALKIQDAAEGDAEIIDGIE